MDILTEAQKLHVGRAVADAGERCLMPYFGRLATTDVAYKNSPDDPVSVADKKSEAFLKEALHDVLPHAHFIGEESFAQDASILDLLRGDDVPTWVCDPLDGTLNFVAGKEGFGILLCLVSKGETQAAWLYDAYNKKMTLYDEKYGTTPAFPSVANGVAMRRPLFGLMGRKVFRHPETQRIAETLEGITLAPSEVPSVISYPMLFSGELDFLVFRTTFPWDHLPGLAIAKNLGLPYARWNGEAFRCDDVTHGLLIARNAETYREVRQTLILSLMEAGVLNEK
ncbi:MAG: inositol monophosphatase [Rickettsiales bacterium]